MSKRLDLPFYKNFYSIYFSKYTDTQIKNYWNKQGKNNLSIPNKEYLFKNSKFNWYFYVENNSDIPTFKSETEYFEHWYTKGIFENRLYRFDSNYYKELYPDLNNPKFTEEVLLVHWYLIGRNEGRICCQQNLTQLIDLELEIKNEDLNNCLRQKKDLERSENENNIQKSKLEEKILELTSQFLNAEEKKLSIKKDLITEHYNKELMSIKKKNIDLKNNIEIKEKEQIEKSNENIKRLNHQLSLQLEKKNTQLELKITDLSNKNLDIIQDSLLKNRKELENQRVDYEISLNHKSLILKEQEITKKKNLLIDLELKKKILIAKHEVSDMKNNSEEDEVGDILSEKDLSKVKSKMKEVLKNKLEQDLFSDNLPNKDTIESKIKEKIKETNEATISNKKKFFQQNILDVGIKIVTENKLEIYQRINQVKLDIQNDFCNINKSQLKNKEIFSEQFNYLKKRQIELIDNFKDYYEEISKHKEVTYQKYNNDLIVNKQIYLDIELKENRRKHYQYKNLENEILELDNIREIKSKELEKNIIDEQNIRNKTLEHEIKELQMNIKKNELSVRNQELEIKRNINEIEIKKKKYEQECEQMKLKLVQEKNKKIDNYLFETLNFREKVAEKREKLQSAVISEMNRKNEIEKKKNTLVFETRKNLEETINNQCLELEKNKQEFELEKINKEKLIKEKLDNKLITEIDSLNEKRKIENISYEIIQEMDNFMKKKMNDFDKLQSNKISEFESNWDKFCLEFKEKSNRHLEKVFINESDYSKQFNLYLKFYSKEIEKDLLEIESNIQERNLILLEKRNKYNENLQKISLEDKQNKELAQNNFKINLDNIKKESKIICIEKVNKDNKKYILEKESQFQELERTTLENKQKSVVYFNEIDLDFKNKHDVLINKFQRDNNERELRLSLEKFYHQYILSKENLTNVLSKKISIKFCIEKIQEDIKSDNYDIYMKEYEEQNRLVFEYNQLFRVKKRNIQDKISRILNEISMDEKVNYKTIIEKGRFNKFNMIKNSLENMYKTYPNIFHKQLLGFSESNIRYEIKKYSKNRKKYIAHLHCFNIDNFENIYGEYVSLIKKYFYIIITFSYGNPDYLNSKDLSILKIKNKGMDIGGKVVCLHFLKVNNIKYDIIFFTHSKTNLKKRNEYFSPFLRNEVSLSNVITTLKNNRDLGAIFPNCVHSISKNSKEYKNLQNNNRLYLDELFKILEIKKENPVIFEGNVFMIKKEILEPLNQNLELVYSLLNDEFSFDYNWFKIYNNLGKKVSIKEAYSFFVSSKSKGKIGNNIPLMLKTHPSSLPDGMIEHSIERIWDGLLESRNKSYLVI